MIAAGIVQAAIGVEAAQKDLEQAALRAAGPDGLDRRVLGDRVHCRRWGPGRFRPALSVAQQRGLVHPATRGRYVARDACPAGAERHCGTAAGGDLARPRRVSHLGSDQCPSAIRTGPEGPLDQPQSIPRKENSGCDFDPAL